MKGRFEELWGDRSAGLPSVWDTDGKERAVTPGLKGLGFILLVMGHGERRKVLEQRDEVRKSPAQAGNPDKQR